MRRLDVALAVVVLLIVTTWMATPAMSQFPFSISVSPNGNNFGEVLLEESRSIDLTITNDGFVDLDCMISTEIIDTESPDNSPEYGVTAFDPDLAHGNSLDLTITYTPLNAGPSSVELSVIADWGFYKSKVTVLLTGTGKKLEAEPIAVEIDIKPGSDANPINLNSKGVIPVAILSTDNPYFDATTVDGSTIEFAGASPVHGGGHLKDVDGDGDIDWVGHFKIQEMSIEAGDATTVTLTLKGETQGSSVSETQDSSVSETQDNGKDETSGNDIEGSDTVATKGK